MLATLPTGPVWPALMRATSRWVEVARETAGGSGVVALVLSGFIPLGVGVLSEIGDLLL